MLWGQELNLSGFCDDGNSDNSDGCSNDCQEACGYTCNGGNSFSPDTCTTLCRDGIVTSDADCDDGNEADGDGCSATCAVEFGYNCTHSNCNTSICVEVCGNGEKAVELFAFLLLLGLLFSLCGIRISSLSAF